MDKIRVSTIENVSLDRFLPPSAESPDGRPKKQRLKGQLHLVQHHILFSPSTGSSTTPNEEIWIPYPTINLLTRLPQSIDGLYPLKLRTRTFETFLFLFEKDREDGAEDVWTSIKDCAVATSVEQLYAFYYRLPQAPGNSPKVQQLQKPKSGSSQISSPLSSSPESDIGPVSASSHTPNPSLRPASSSGWDAFNPRAEFARQGVGVRTKAWRFTDINKDYSFCPTYPAKLVVPSRISDNVLTYAGKYRSKARIPALTYLHWANHASITRSSQPMVGLKNSRSAQDEKLVECIFSTHLSAESAYVQSSATSNDPLSPTSHSQSLPQVYGATATNLIIDARPTTNAMANVAIGAGTENMDNYKSGKKAYLGIDNIHVMRNSLRTIDDAVKEAEDLEGSIDRLVLRKSNWLRHISTLLDGALVIVKNIHLNASHVLVHCSDGWDRTSQLSAIAQVCLDPYYRTLEGFRVLIEKDWLAFGHKFLDRSGHLSSEKQFTVAEAPDDDSEDEIGGAQKAAQAFFASMQKQFSSSNSHLKEVSPVFHQFLECVWQLQRQFPNRFEFDQQFLIDIHYHLYACQLGTFLFNNEEQRRMARPPQGDNEGGAYIDRTVSAWDFFPQEEKNWPYHNPSYDPTLDDRDARGPDADQGVLLPDPKDVKFWWTLFRRGEEEMNGSKLALQQQAQGAQMLEVGAGQVDPVSMEGALLVDKSNPLEVPYTVRRTPSPAVTPGRDPMSSFDRNRQSPKPRSVAGPSSDNDSGLGMNGIPGLGSSLTTPQKAAGSSRAGAAGGGGGWNWTQFSSGAFSAIQKSARDIRTIGQEAMQQLRAEAGQLEGEMWAKTDGRGGDSAEAGFAPGTGIGEGRGSWRGPSASGSGSQSIPRMTVRLPSENNPWSTSTNAVPTLSDTLGDRSGTAPRTTVPGQPFASTRPTHGQQQQPNTQRQGSLTTNPWGEQKKSPSLADLSLRDDDNDESRVKRPGGSGQDPKMVERGSSRVKPVSSVSVAKAEPTDKDVLDALGGDAKAWDPLGAA